MRDLQWMTGSVGRARIIAHVLRDGAGLHTVADLSEALGIQRSAAHREVRGLVEAGFLRPAAYQGRRSAVAYEVVPDQPGLGDLRRFVQLNLGQAGTLRDALLASGATELAWICGRYAEGRLTARLIDTVVLARDRRAIEAAIGGVRPRVYFTVRSRIMSLGEWAYRLERRELRVMALRRASRLWLIGNDETLRSRERSEIEFRGMKKRLIANWREELSDDWDDSWDPFRPFPFAPR